MAQSKLNPQASITLREITFETVREICRLSDTLADEQHNMVAPNAISIAQAHFCEQAWFRAIYAEETPVGFVMLHIDEDKAKYYLWRLMIGGVHQGNGFGLRAMELVIAEVQSRRNATSLVASYVPMDGGPKDFYRKLGFEPTGEIHDGEVGIRLTW